jgi:hypothetical protein
MRIDRPDYRKHLHFWSEALNKRMLPIHANGNMDKKNNRKTVKNTYSRTRS